ncbi:unnamed protein product [Microthlaspi erraticum]|uniref:F-box domain-containing protein n=1 Tax=Microthlaspi erraticum TaxID=1685480 RepID=A0A6D2LH84_9BRAS|nr:unnamed protein product [Microthlaspi erraticum]
MTMVSHIPQDLLEEILSRLPIKSLGAVRSTCKQWNDLSKNQSFTKIHRDTTAKAMMFIMMNKSRTCLMSVNLNGSHNHKDLVDPSIEQIGKLYHVEILNVFHCDGLLLCSTRDKRLVVWNPYLGKTRWIKARNSSVDRIDRYGIGHDNNKNHKILRFLYRYEQSVGNHRICECEIYDLRLNSWRVLHVTLHSYPYFSPGVGVSLKGNIYFHASKRLERESRQVLVSFDCTSEGFGPCLHLPFQTFLKDDVTLSTVREEQLAVLLNHKGKMEIWVTTKIETNGVSWCNFLKVDKIPFFSESSMFLSGSFFLDEEKKVALICYTGVYKETNKA